MLSEGELARIDCRLSVVVVQIIYLNPKPQNLHLNPNVQIIYINPNPYILHPKQ